MKLNDSNSAPARVTLAVLICSATLLTTFSGCNQVKPQNNVSQAEVRNLWVGTAIAGDGNELAAIDVIIGEKSGPAGAAFASGLANQKQGHPAVITVLQPNVAVKPSTLLVSRVTLTGVDGSVQFFDPVQQGVARAIVDSVTETVISRDKAEDLVVIVSVFIHPDAKEHPKLFENNYEAAKSAIKRAMASEPSVGDIEKVRQKK